MIQIPPRAAAGFTTEIRRYIGISDGLVCVDIDAIQIAVVSARINMIAVNGRDTSGAGKHRRSESVIGVFPGGLASGKIKAPEAITHRIIPIEQVNVAVFDDRTSITSANRNGP